MVRTRISFRKVGVLRFTSHLDTVGIVQRSLLSAGLPLCYSRGYNPRPKLSFGPPLKTGWEGHDEYFDVYLEEPIRDLVARTQGHLPPGFEFKRAVFVPLDAPRLAVDVSAAAYEIHLRPQALGSEAPEELLRRLEAKLQVGREGSRFLRVALRSEGEWVRVEYLARFHEGREARPEEVTAALATEHPPAVTIRKALYVERKGRLLSPIEGVKPRKYERDHH